MFQRFAIFGGVVSFWDVINYKGPPLWGKFFQKLFLIAPKKRPVTLNAMQKTPALYKVWFLRKSRIRIKNINFGQNCKKCFFRGISGIFSVTIVCKELGFFVSCSVHQGASFELSKRTFKFFF